MEEGACKKMCLLLDAIEEEGIKIGIEQGIEKLAIYYMQNDSSLSKEKALDMARAILE